MIESTITGSASSPCLPGAMWAAPVPEVSRSIDVERTHAAMLTKVGGNDLSIRQSCITGIEAREELARRIIDHRQQAQLVLSASLQPVMLGAVHQHHLASCSAARPTASVLGTMALDLHRPSSMSQSRSVLGWTGPPSGSRARCSLSRVGPKSSNRLDQKPSAGLAPGAPPEAADWTERPRAPMKHRSVPFSLPLSSHSTELPRCHAQPLGSPGSPLASLQRPGRAGPHPRARREGSACGPASRAASEQTIIGCIGDDDLLREAALLSCPGWSR
jgi:hypothetical protein